MGRRPRIDPDGGWHHVMNRGLAKQQIFFTRSDGEYFESLLNDAFERTGVEVHAYCLMSNHFHLLLHCPQAGLSEFMRLVGSGYTRHQNRRQGRDGPIFRGRFLSLPVDSEAYLQTVGRYIHRNPMDIRPPVDLTRYRWSSLRNHCGGVPAPPWMKISLLDDHRNAGAYLDYVTSDDVGGSAVDWAIATAIAEHDSDELLRRPNVDRTVAMLMLPDADETLASAIEAELCFPSDAARRKARSRAERRAVDEEELREVARRALRLAS